MISKQLRILLHSFNKAIFFGLSDAVDVAILVMIQFHNVFILKRLESTSFLDFLFRQFGVSTKSASLKIVASVDSILITTQHVLRYQVSHYVVHPHALVPGTKYSHLVKSFPLTLLLLPYRMRDTTTTNLYTEEEEKVAEEEWEDTTTTTTARLWRLLHLSSHSLPD